MEYQKIIYLLNNEVTQPFKCKTKNGLEIKDARGTYNTNSKIICKTTMLKSSVCDYSDSYVLVKGTITVAEQ